MKKTKMRTLADDPVRSADLFQWVLMVYLRTSSRRVAGVSSPVSTLRMSQSQDSLSMASN